jgi:hypothetical protein
MHRPPPEITVLRDLLRLEGATDPVMLHQMVDTALKVRVDRLLSDDFRVEDLSTLFLAMRRCAGRETVMEIGDFVAHRDERTRGLTTRVTRDFFLFLRGYVNLPIDISNLPAKFAEMIDAAFRRIDDARLRTDTGLKRTAAERKVAAVIRKVSTDSAGRSFIDGPSSAELTLINGLMRHFFIKPAFNDDDLFEDFCASLISNDLLEPKQREEFARIKPVIALYAIACMHECIIDLGDGTKAALSASINCGSGTMGVYAEAEVIANGINVRVNGPMFTTSLKGADHCEPSLLISPMPKWNCHLELTPRKTLAELGTIIHYHPQRSPTCF